MFIVMPILLPCRSYGQMSSTPAQIARAEAIARAVVNENLFAPCFAPQIKTAHQRPANGQDEAS